MDMASCARAIIWLREESMLNPRHFSESKNLVHSKINNFSECNIQSKKKRKKNVAVAIAKSTTYKLYQSRTIFQSISLYPVG